MKIISPKISRFVGGKILKNMDDITITNDHKYDVFLGNLIDVSSKTLITHRPVMDIIQR